MAPYQYPDQERLSLIDRFLLLHQNYGTHYRVNSEVRPRLRFLKNQQKRVFFISLKELDIRTPHTHSQKL